MHKTERRLRRLDLNDLPRYTEWAGKLLSSTAQATRLKTEKEVNREFQGEKWKRLLGLARSLDNPTLAEIERAYLDPSTVFPCFSNGGFYLANQRQLLDQHLDLYAEVLEPHLKGASCLVELGAGFGSKIFGLAERKRFSKLPLVAGEFTANGRALLSLLGNALDKPIAVGHCDFRMMRISGVAIPPKAVIFTSYAVHYVPRLSPGLIGFLSRLRPRVVVHFEPCYEHYSPDTLHGLLCRRYMELNDYARNLVSVVSASRERGRISMRVRKTVLGSNPFLPISVIEWKPTVRQ